MIIDTSAVAAILRDEPDADRYVDAIARAPERMISAATYVECAVVVDANGDPVLSRRLDDLLAAAAVTVEPFTPRQAEMARQAYRDFGRGSGHPAALNLGDCFAYALARDTGQALLFKGADFSHTDIMSALGPQGR